MNLPQPLQPARFLRRLNRFAAEVRLGPRTVLAHVANSGRLGELLVPDAEVYVHRSGREGRATTHDLLLVRYAGVLVSIDSRAPAAIAAEALAGPGIPPVGVAHEVEREVAFGAGRLDILARADTREWLIEVKGCTLVRGRTAIFPDAPTERGRRHVEELTEHARQGGKAMVMFVIQREDAEELRPNHATDPRFAKALREAEAAGVAVQAHTCDVTTKAIALARGVPVRLDEVPLKGAARSCV